MNLVGLLYKFLPTEAKPCPRELI